MTEHFERRRLKDRIVDNISKAIKQVQHLQLKQPHEPVILTNETQEFKTLIEQIDHAMLHGLKKLTTGYWELVKEFTPKSVLDDVTNMNLVVTPLGRSRAWLYMALQDNMLESYLRCMLEHLPRVLRYYHTDALLLDQGLMHIILTLITGLESFQFQLQPNMAYLDLASNSNTQAPLIVTDIQGPPSNVTFQSLVGETLDLLRPMRRGIPAAAVDDAVDVAGLEDPESSCLPTNPSRWLRHSRSSDLDKTDQAPEVEVIRQKVRRAGRSKKSSISSEDRRKRRVARSDTSSLASTDSVHRANSVSDTDKTKQQVDPRVWQSGSMVETDFLPEDQARAREDITDAATSCNGNVGNEVCNGNVKCVENGEHDSDSRSSHVTSDDRSHVTSKERLDNSPVSRDRTPLSMFESRPISSAEWLADIVNQNLLEDQARLVEEIIKKNTRQTSRSPAAEAEGASDGTDASQTSTCTNVFQHSLSYSECIAQGLTHPPTPPVVENGASTEESNLEEKAGSLLSVNTDSVESMDVASSGVSHSSDASELQQPQDCSVVLDNNQILIISLEYFEYDHEQFSKAFQTTVGHSEGSIEPVLVVLSDRALYLFLHSPLESYQLKLHDKVTFKELDYVSLSVDYQIINIVCINRRKQFWLSTGNQQLTRSFVNELDRAVRQCIDTVPLLSLLYDATTQKIALKKWLADECQCQRSEVNLLRYSLVHWQRCKQPSTYNNSRPELQATLMYLPFTRKHRQSTHSGENGRSSHLQLNNGASETWRPVYCVLKHGRLKLYTNRASVDNDPLMSLYLNPDKCVGCRYCRHSPHAHTFEVLLSEGCGVMLSCQSAKQCHEWLQALCYWVHHLSTLEDDHVVSGATPSSAVLTSHTLVTCLEDVQTHFVRILATLSLIDLSQVMVDNNEKRFCVLCVDTPHAVCPEQWTLYFSTAAEMEAMLTAIQEAWQQLFKVELPVVEVTDPLLQKQSQKTLKSINKQTSILQLMSPHN